MDEDSDEEKERRGRGKPHSFQHFKQKDGIGQHKLITMAEGRRLGGWNRHQRRCHRVRLVLQPAEGSPSGIGGVEAGEIGPGGRVLGYRA